MIYSNLLKVLDGEISAGKCCPPEHFKKRHRLLQDLPQGLGVGQKTLDTPIVQNLQTELSKIQ